MRFPRTPVVLAVLSLGLAACSEDEPTDPQPLEPLPAEVYVVQTVEGAALPAVVHVAPPVEGDEHTYRVFVVSDTLRLIANGRYEHRARLVVRDETDRIVDQPRRTDRGTWRTDGTGIHFESEYIENVRFTGIRTSGGSTLVATQDIVWDDGSTPKEFVYVRR